jgi:SNF2 family DNA or RNA helicase
MTEMGLGKTFTGAEKMMELGAKVNLVVCQKSKINDWIEHFETYYRYIDDKRFLSVFDLTDKKQFTPFLATVSFNTGYCVGVINYDLLWRRPELTKLTNFTLILDESSLIQNETTKRSKFILKLKPDNVILLSGTPTSGRYENLYSQLKLLGWNISKTTYWNTYIIYHYEDFGGYPFKVIDGYKNVDRLKRKMREYGCHFLKTEDVLELPEQIFTTIKVDSSKEYKKFKKTRVVEVEDTKLIGDNTLTKMLYERQLCSLYSKNKLEAFRDLVNSTNDRLIVFYNFTSEYELLNWEVCDIEDKPTSIVNGTTKDLTAYEECENSVTFIQYQAGAMGLNLQLANKIIYFSPPLSSELYEQSKKRTHRIGQSKTCYYYNLTVTDSIEEKIYKSLAMRRDYTNKLFEEGE